MSNSIITTPSLVCDFEKLQINIQKMKTLAEKHKVHLRPMVKTHKCPQIIQMQLQAGAKGMLVTSIKEAIAALSVGCTDITFAYPHAQTDLYPALRELVANTKLTFTIDHIDHITYLANCFPKQTKINVLLKIDSGLHRLGILPTQTSTIKSLVNAIRKNPMLQFSGFSTHAGHVYAGTADDVQRIAKVEQNAILTAYHAIELRPTLLTTAIGSTPTVLASESFSGISEIRPGNYIFFDRIQESLGVATLQQCPLYVRASVLSRPCKNQIIIDAGSKQLSLDKGTHGNQSLRSYGLILEEPEADLFSLSEELGWVRVSEQSKIKPGDILHIVPNHACATASRYRHLQVVDKNGKLIDTWNLATGN